MAVNLLDSVKGMLTPDVVSKAAESTGESPDKTREALHGAVPAVLAGFAKSTATPGGATRIFGAVTESGATGSGLMGKVFGDRGGAVGDALAKSSGIKGSSASHLLALVSPLVAGVLGKQILANRLGPGGLSQLLAGQKRSIAEDRSAPPGLAQALGVGSLSEIGGTTGTTETAAARAGGTVREPPHGATDVSSWAVAPSRAESRHRSPWGILLPVVVLLGAFAVWGISALVRGQGPRGGVTAPQPTLPTLPKLPTPQLPQAPHAPGTPEVKAPTAPEIKAPTAQAPAAPTAPTEQGAIALPDGKTLQVDPNGGEAQLAHYLGDPSASLPQTVQLDNLHFESGTATIAPESGKTVGDVAAMLQAYPSARVRVEGFTDNVGDPAANLQLSKARASAVADMLAAKGVARDRIDTAGKSEQSPVAENQSAEGRARNRRVDLVLLDR